MKIEQLERFLIVADCLNFTTAAERLYVGQSTISRQIAALEDELGVMLLIRGPRSVELTEAGRVMQAEGLKLMEHLDQITQHVKEAGSGAVGSLKITTIPAYIPLLSELHRRILEKYPKLMVNFSYSNYEKIPRELDVGKSDLGVTFSFLHMPSPEYETMSLCPEYFCVLCGKRHWIAQRDGVYLDELRTEDFLYGRSGLHLVTNPLDFRSKAVESDGKGTANKGMEDTLMQLAVSDAIVVLPSVVAKYLQSNLACVPILDDYLKHELILVWRKDCLSQTLPRFLEVTREYQEEQKKKG